MISSEHNIVNNIPVSKKKQQIKILSRRIKSQLNGFGELCATRAVQWGARGGIEPRTQRTSDLKFNNINIRRAIRTSRRGPTPLLTSSFSAILRCAFRADVVHPVANILILERRRRAGC